eukprot:scaffold31575_cov60-Attheya_sp.AAC.1
MDLRTNGGSLQSNKECDVPELGLRSWFNKNAVTNILSFAEVADKFQITYDNQSSNDLFIVHVSAEKNIKFKRGYNNLYFYKPEEDKLSRNVFVNTLKENKKFHTVRQFERAKRAREFYHAMGTPSIPDLLAILRMNIVKDNAITIEDIKLAEKIFGPDVATLKGKTTRRKPLVVIKDAIMIPRELVQAQQHVTMAMDGMTDCALCREQETQILHASNQLERVQATYHHLLYTHLPKILVKYLVSEATKNLNFFRAKHGVSKYYSPRMILHQQNLDFNKHCKYSIGSYVQGHDEPAPTNTNASRTLDCIYLRYHNTAQGGHELLHLAMNKVVIRRNVTPVPITPGLIKRVTFVVEQDNMEALMQPEQDNQSSLWAAASSCQQNEARITWGRDEACGHYTCASPHQSTPHSQIQIQNGLEGFSLHQIGLVSDDNNCRLQGMSMI